MVQLRPPKLRADQYKERGGELRDMAKRTTMPGYRRALEELARQYEKMAHDVAQASE